MNYDLKYTQPKKLQRNLKSAAKNKTEKTLRITEKNFQDEELAHELLLTTIQANKKVNAFTNNTLPDIKLSKAQICKKIQSGRYFSWYVM